MHDYRENMALLGSQEPDWTMSQCTSSWQGHDQVDSVSYLPTKAPEISAAESDSPLKKHQMDESNIGAASGDASMDTCSCPKESGASPSSPSHMQVPIYKSTAAEASSPKSSSLKYSGGARPKTTTSLKTPKKVTWSEKNCISNSIDCTQYEQGRTLLLALRISDKYFDSPAFKAAKFMLSDQSHYLVELAAKMLRVKHNRDPKSQELLEIAEECNEKQIVLEFIEAYQSEQGHSIVESLLSDSGSCEQQKGGSDAQPGMKEYWDEAQEQSSHSVHSSDARTSIDKVKMLDPLPQKQTDLRKLTEIALRREQKYLKDSLTCLLCKERQIEVTLLPCGHFVLCGQCSENCYVCPVCNKDALGEVKTYLG